MKKLVFSFDIGHASIGWAVLDTTINHKPELQGCGTVLFPTDDCLASTRRQLRRQRRHIRSTRMRIARLKRLLAHLGVLTEAEMDQPGGPWPWKLAARVHAGGKLLSWREIWDVLRWYAHNRGYDGNRKWSRDEEEDGDDTAKEKAAKALMEKLGRATMCETICAKLQVDPLSDDNKASSIAYKTSNAAFPRDIVLNEVIDLLVKHVGHLPQVTPALITALCAEDNAAVDERTVRDVLKELGFDAHLPRRFVGGLLFGQAVPRFDNRIIGECPVSGEKRPLKDCREFLEFRFAEILANVTLKRTEAGEDPTLTDEERKELIAKAREAGGFTAGEFKKAVLEVSGAVSSNADLMMTHPDADEALVLDPALRFAKTNGMMKAVWKDLPLVLQKRLLGRWNKHRRVTWQWLLNQPEAPKTLEAKLQAAWKETKRKPRKGDLESTWEEKVRQSLKPNFASGRAPYSRTVMMAAVDEIMQGKHPRETGGVLEMTEARKERERQKEIDELTNNHLVRHRLKILLRLVDDMVRTYAEGDSTQVDSCVIEVARDLLEFSGKTNKEVAQELGIKLKNFKDVSKKLVDDLADTKIPIGAGLIRKARIADDLGWTCPYTGKEYDAVTLARGKVDKDHIIPRSLRPSDSLDSLVVTFDAVNKWKSNRTAWKFIEEEQGKPVPGRPDLTIVTMKQYENFVSKLAGEKRPSRFSPGAGSLDDRLRQWSRKQKMLLKDYEEKEFTPRDLTVTSHLVRLSARQIEKRFEHLRDTGWIVSLPGSVTGVVRKSWDCLGCLAPACPEVMGMRPSKDKNGELVVDESGESKQTLQVRPKGDIRNITHLHHALDACVIGFASILLPNNGKLWEQLVTRKVRPNERVAFSQMHGWNPMLRLSSPVDAPNEKTTWRLQVADLPAAFKNQIVERLKERRVVQHVPADMSGSALDANPWGIVSADEKWVTLRQRKIVGHREDGSRIREWKMDKGNPVRRQPGRLIGLMPGKLSRIKAVLEINANYGLLLDPTPIIVPFHKVHAELEKLSSTCRGRPLRVIRNGCLIRVSGEKYPGIWRVRSCIDNAQKGILLRISRADRVQDKQAGVDWCKDNVSLKTLLADGLEIVQSTYVGIAEK